ncbi:MAG: GAF domain-containing protein [Okeania sp. SIO2F4]|uniref:ATP-binding protein n=1 Tax=Okeania sp. SIO2F4 TaxID=2607790 RepID=UPI00142970C0|nr:ATP-binding protein [Okeania sp. SIO2F4]NES04105.1 GAF domain-containing protein [Okeania sp. SIO2F4]
MESKEKIIITQRVNSNIDYNEQIHIPNFIQDHGVLLVLQEPYLDIIQVSINTEEWLNIPPENLLGQNIKCLLDSHLIDNIRQNLAGYFEYINPVKLSIQCGNEVRLFNSIIHRNDGVVILELEPCEDKSEPDFSQFYQLTFPIINKIHKSANLHELCEIVVQEIRKITGFDRVMIYKFHPDDSGEVIAEDKREDQEAYLGLYYPAYDVPQVARAVFSVKFIRTIPNINSSIVELLPKFNPLTNQPLDLTFSVLRGVSPCHIEYLDNMGVMGSMSISLVKEGKLWGLIACHHQSIKYIPYDKRVVCEFLGQIMSIHIPMREQNDNLDYKVTLKSVQSEVIKIIYESEDLLNVITNIGSKLLTIVGATGAAISLEGEYHKVGKTPTDPEITELINWVNNQINTDIYSTDYLPKIYPSAKEFKEIASGLLVLEIAKLQEVYVLWFRPEVSQTVNWAGNPEYPIQIESDGTMKLCPRKSFEQWQEILQFHSLPWQSYEIEGAQEFKTAIVGIVMRRISELAKINLELEQSNSELDSFTYIASHDLKEPLRGIHNYSTFLMEDYGEIIDQDGREKLETLVRLTQRMEDLINALLFFSRLGRQELHKSTINLNKLIENVAEVVRMSKPDASIEIRKMDDLPVIYGDKILMEEVFSNLINNGVKYNKKEDKIVEIGYEETEESASTIYVKDNGIGIREKHQETIFKIFKRLHGKDKFGGGTGVGLTIVKKIIERHGGKIWLESKYGEGTTFYVKLWNQE